MSFILLKHFVFLTELIDINLGTHIDKSPRFIL